MSDVHRQPIEGQSVWFADTALPSDGLVTVGDACLDELRNTVAELKAVVTIPQG